MQGMERDGSRISRWRARAGSYSSWTPEPELFLLGLTFLYRPQNTGVEDLSCSEASGPQRDTPGSSSQACPWKSINNHDAEAPDACHVPGTPEALVHIHRSVQSSRHPCSAGFPASVASRGHCSAGKPSDLPEVTRTVRGSAAW